MKKPQHPAMVFVLVRLLINPVVPCSSCAIYSFYFVELPVLYVSIIGNHSLVAYAHLRDLNVKFQK